MSTAKNITYIATEKDFNEKPDLRDLLNNVDQLISEYMRKNQSDDEAQVRRFVAGHAANDDLVETSGRFFTLKEQPRAPPTDWNVLMGLAMNDTAGNRFSENAVKRARLYQERLEDDEQLKARFELKKAELDAKAKANPKPTMKRSDACKQGFKQIYTSLDYMYRNYGYHLALVGAKNDISQQLEYPPVVHGNTATAFLVLQDVSASLGAPLDQYFFHRISNRELVNVDEKFPPIEELQKASREKVMRVFWTIALKKWQKFCPEAKKVPWRRLFDSNDKTAKIVGWPEEDCYQFQYKDNQIYWKSIKKEKIVDLIEQLKNGRIVFEMTEN